MYRKLVFIAALCAACFARAQTGSVITVGEYIAGEDWTADQLAPMAVLATNTAVAMTNLETRVGVLETNSVETAGALTNVSERVAVLETNSVETAGTLTNVSGRVAVLETNSVETAGTLTNVVERVVDLEARPAIPTNSVAGWLLYDSGSNLWVTVTVSNMVFYGDYIDE